MPRPKQQAKKANGDLGFEGKLWAAADALRNNMDAAEYKHVVLGLIFLKYISDAFEEYHARLETERPQGADPEDPDEYPSGCRPRSVGLTSRPRRSSPPSAGSSTTPWPASSGTTPRSKGCCPGTTPVRRWTSSGSASSSTW